MGVRAPFFKLKAERRKTMEKIKISFLFAWYDIWIGAFWDAKKKWLYILPLPMLGIIIKFPKEPKTTKYCNSCHQYIEPFTCDYEKCADFTMKKPLTQSPPNH